MTCRLVDAGDGDVACLTHDVLADPAWPDAMNTRPQTADHVCPLAGEPTPECASSR